MVALNTPYGTLAFPHFFQPKERQAGDGKPVFSGTLIFNPAQQKSPPYKALVDACIEAARAEFGPKISSKDVKMPFRAGSDKSQFDGFEDDDMFINPWTKSKPGIVNAQRQDVLLPEEVWAGQLVRFNVTPYAWTASGKKGVSLALNHVQIIKTDTPRIDGRASPSSAFDDGEVDEAAADLF